MTPTKRQITADPLTPNGSPRHLLGGELRRWRQMRGLSVARLAGLVFVSRELLQKVETAHRNAGHDLIAACDAVLNTGGVLARLLDYAVHQERETARKAPVEPEAQPPATPPAAVPVTILITVTAELMPPTGLGGQPSVCEPVSAAVVGSGGARIYQFPTARRPSRSR